MSSSLNKFLENVSDIDVSPNEIMYTHQFNRNFVKLLENDIYLDKMANSILGSFNIKQWIGGNRYAYGDLVWYSGPNNDSLYLLRSIEDQNEKVPDIKLVNGRLDNDALNQSGWNDQNRYMTLIELGLESLVKRDINSRLLQHVNSEQHRYGRLSPDTISMKLLKSDLSNRDTNREHYFFPYETRFLQKDDYILDGFARRYDNGLLEYDITFRMSYDGIATVDGVSSTRMKCNSVLIKNTSTFTPDNADYTGNERFFQTVDDYGIFQPKSSGISEIGTSVQTNRNDFVNTYHADIHLIDAQKFMFKDNKYMIYCSDVMTQDRNYENKTINPGSNTIVFTNKSAKALTAIYVTYPENGKLGSSSGGLTSNSFHCKLIGKARA